MDALLNWQEVVNISNWLGKKKISFSKVIQSNFSSMFKSS